MTHTMLATDPGAEGWWSEFDRRFDCLAPGGSISPAEIGRRRNLAEDAASEHVAARPDPDHPHGKVVIVRDGGTCAMTVVPRTAQLDLAKLQRVTRRWGLALASQEEFRRLFPDYEIGSVPPFGHLFGLPVYLDRGLTAEAELVFESGARREEFSLLMGEYVRIERPGIASLA